MANICKGQKYIFFNFEITLLSTAHLRSPQSSPRVFRQHIEAYHSPIFQPPPFYQQSQCADRSCNNHHTRHRADPGPLIWVSGDIFHNIWIGLSFVSCHGLKPTQSILCALRPGGLSVHFCERTSDVT